MQILIFLPSMFITVANNNMQKQKVMTKSTKDQLHNSNMTKNC